MKIEERCPVCSGERFVSHPAQISPFIRERMFHNAGPNECLLQHCIKCDFRFFNIRPDSAEMDKLYSGYRGMSYQQQREKSEPFYTQSFNQMTGNNPIEVKQRGALLQQVLTKNGVSSDISVLDFGGNDGRFIPKHITGEKYCYDISGNAAVPGVSMLGSQDLIGRTFGLVLLAHVLEHVSYPRDLMKEVTSLMLSSSLLYIELPEEVSLTKLQLFKKIAKSVMFRSQQTPAMHEHINQFTTQSLRNLLVEMGLECIDIGTKRVDLGWAKVNLLYCLSRKSILQVERDR